MDAYMITFRIIHIVSAILWFGGATFCSLFVGPSLVSIGPEATRRGPAASGCPVHPHRPAHRRGDRHGDGEVSGVLAVRLL